jgi:pilus assembly protein CpaC
VNVKIGRFVLLCCFVSAGAFSTSNSEAQATAGAAGAAPPPVSTGQDSANDLVVGAGKAVLVDTALQVERIAVGSSDIAEATAVSPTEVMLNGKAPGETSLIIWQRGGARQFFNVQVRAANTAVNDKLDSARRELRSEFPGQTFRLTSENGQVFLRGTVKDLASSDRAVQIASTAGKVVNLLYVDVPAADPQILLKVRFASLDRSLTKQLGINIFSLGAANTVGSVTTQQYSPPTISSSQGGSNGGGVGGSDASATLSNLLNVFVFRPDINLGATLQALQTKGVVQILAEPNVLTLNGKQGSLLAGGQYPYPVIQGTSGGAAAAVTIQFKEFGIRMNFIPTITPRGTIRLQVAPEVSSLDVANGVTIAGFTVPGLDIRRVKTEVELQDGQSFAIGGLLDNRETQTLSKIPFIGDVPILGKFFQSIDKRKSNTELIVIVTPEVVSPIPAGAPLPQLKFPETFLPSASGIPMTTPNAGGAPKPSAPTTMPVERLIQSMQPEQNLNTEGVTGYTAPIATTPGNTVQTPQ